MRNIFDILSNQINPVRFWRHKGAKIGGGVIISRKASLSTEPYLIEIGDNTEITSYVEFITHDGSVNVLRNLRDDLKKMDLVKGKIVVGKNCFFGNHSAVLSGVSIGDNCIIGFGTVVTKDVPSNSVVVGVPGKVISTIDEFKEKNQKFFVETKHLNKKSKQKKLLEIYK